MCESNKSYDFGCVVPNTGGLISVDPKRVEVIRVCV